MKVLVNSPLFACGAGVGRFVLDMNSQPRVGEIVCIAGCGYSVELEVVKVVHLPKSNQWSKSTDLSIQMSDIEIDTEHDKNCGGIYSQEELAKMIAPSLNK